MPNPTQQIQDLLSRDLSQHIEEIIKLTQADEATVYTELTEYVATKRIREHYRALLKAMADAPSEPNEGVGIWISGFFGSGKSSFAKNLGYVLANRTVRGHRAADLFKRQLDDPAISQWVDFITARIPTEVIMFDVSVERAVRKTTERIADILYTQLLRSLGYAEDFDIAELEIELEREGKLDAFVARVQSSGGPPWEVVRTGAQKMNRASAALYEMDPRTYPAADSWARSLSGRNADITVAKLVDRAFELMARRRPGKSLTFIVDEVGQYVSQSAEKLNDLRAVVERFGQESKNRIRARQAIAPVWIVVTSQEKLEEVVSALDSRRVQLAMVQDRFRHRVDLAPADISEVATKRVLDKKPTAVPELRRLFTQVQGQLNTACHLERSHRSSEVREDDFVRFYPYLPHYIELSIDIMSGIRLQPGAPRHLGGSNRTIIKQAHQMLVAPRTNLAAQPVGRLVTMDLIYELVEGNLSFEKRKDISDITERFKGDRTDGGWAARVAKALCLLEFVRDLPRTETNIAAVLVDEAGKPAPVPEVKAAIARLEQAQFVRHTEEGWKLLTAQEKNWDTERKQYLGPKERERNDILRETLLSIFGDTKLRTYKHHDLHTFKVGLKVEDVQLESGAIPLDVLIAEEPGDLPKRVEEARGDSRFNEHKNDIYWIFAVDPELDDLIRQVHASSQMIAKYNQAGAQGERSAEITPLLEGEKRDQVRYKSRLRETMDAALLRGQGLFRGVSKDASDLGRSLAEVFRHFFEFAVPDLYPKLEMGARHLTGNEAEEALKVASLNALPQVFHGGENGLNLVVKEGAKYVPNIHAEIAKEVLDYLKREHSYGNRVTGKELDAHFTGLGYGWDLDVIKLVLALLLRAGAVEVTYQGRRYRNAQDPQCRTPLTTNTAFKQASFTPRESIDLRTLTAAVRSFEMLTGDEVDVEEGAIAEALKKLANDEITALLPARAEVRANGLPGQELLDDYYTTLTTIQNAASDDCVRMLAGEGNSIKELRSKARRIREALTPETLGDIARARRILGEQWPVLEARLRATQLWTPRAEGIVDDEHEVEASQRVADDLTVRAKTLHDVLADEAFYDHLPEIRRIADELAAAYAQAYERAHAARYRHYDNAIDGIKGTVAWTQVSEEAQAGLLAPLMSRRCEHEAPQLAHSASTCSHCDASFSQMDS
ncbi:MAG TPA: BREX system P-loop protein BrxC, partial [Ktedonobacterales bacterium]|nr:BREX system P-loop protein BrxC [Ktedonobacterales bacterium]